MAWIDTRFGMVPPAGRMVLVQVDKEHAMPATVAVGYTRKDPYGELRWVIPGVGYRGGVRYWSDCLGDDFMAPLWGAPRMEIAAHSNYGQTELGLARQPERTCSTCRYWVADQATTDGVCNRYPPRKNNAQRPETKNTDFCGEHVPR